jgi:hypothetical protein
MKAEAWLFTASQICVALGMSRWGVFTSGARPGGRIKRSYGTVRGFSTTNLPRYLQERLERERVAHKARSVCELVRIKQQKIRKTNAHQFARGRLAPDVDALLRKRILDHYFFELDNGINERTANLHARVKWMAAFSKACHERTIRRLATRVEGFGGPDLAPIDAYSADKSFPHARGGGRQTHGAAATAAARRQPYDVIA